MNGILVMVLGLPGVGKSYFARALARRIGAIHLNSDIVRKEIFKDPGYTDNEKSQVYDEMFRRVCFHLEQGQIVIVDATFSKASDRLKYLNHIKKTGDQLNIIQITADEAIVKERLKVKRPDSDADFEVYQKIKDEYDKISLSRLILSSSEISLDEMISRAWSYINAN